MGDTAPHSEDTGSQLSVRKLGVFLGAEINSIDLTKQLDPQTVVKIRELHAEYGVLIFPEQKIDQEDLKRFGRYFGELTVHPFSRSTEEEPEVIIFFKKYFIKTTATRNLF